MGSIYPKTQVRFQPEKEGMIMEPSCEGCLNDDCGLCAKYARIMETGNGAVQWKDPLRLFGLAGLLTLIALLIIYV